MSRGLGSIKLSSPATREFWELAVLFEDAELLAVDKPARFLSCPDRYDPARPNLMRLLHEGIREGKPWATERALTYLANVHRLDFETSGVFLLAKTKTALTDVANQFGSEKPHKTYIALVQGSPEEDQFEVDVRLTPDLRRPGLMRWAREGKKSLTRFEVLERFQGVTLLACHPVTGRTHQIRVHLKCAGYPIYGDDLYGEGIRLNLSDFKRGYRLKPGRVETPLTPSLALHAWKLEVTHPVTHEPVRMEAPWPRMFEVALRQLRRHGALRYGRGPTRLALEPGSEEDTGAED